ncbi:MAG: hypothetical protein MJK15_03005 [Colwellia sp.]|nr:hypothetical protein [Colwellia sp.]
MSDLKKIEILEVNGIKEGIVHRQCGDICSIDKDLANAYIGAGLAKCVETGEVGERVEGVSKIKIDKITTIISSK